MSAEVIQLLFYAGFTILGWWLRHKGFAAPSIPPLPAQPTPTVPGGHVTEDAVLAILKSLLEKINTQAVPTK
jgi:hypothetical protein